MTLRELDNLIRIGQLKAEPRNPTEFIRMLDMARTSAGRCAAGWCLAGRTVQQRLQRSPCGGPGCAGMDTAAKLEFDPDYSKMTSVSPGSPAKSFALSVKSA